MENAKSKDAYNCATDKCVMAFSQALLKHEEPPESCSCNSTWIQLDALRQHCSKAGNGGTVCPLSEVIVDGQKVLECRTTCTQIAYQMNAIMPMTLLKFRSRQNKILSAKVSSDVNSNLTVTDYVIGYCN